jgi:serine/threonine protein kinase
MRGNSISNINRISSISSMPTGKNGPKGLSCSEKCPWIIKTISFPQSPLINDWEIGRIIGTGLMGAVRIVKIKPINGFFALKAIRKDYIYRHHDQRHINNERNLLLQLTSSFCIRMFSCFQDNTNVYFALEIAAGGELFRRLSKKVYFEADTAKFYATEIFSAIEHIQNLGYVYRDLKPENVMLDEEGHCKLVDFGFAVQPDEEGLIHTICGTPAYLTPEQLNGKFTNGYTNICDFWSFGIFLYGIFLFLLLISYIMIIIIIIIITTINYY